MTNAGLAWGLVIIASLSTVFGTCLMFTAGDALLNRKTITVLFGLAAGVMVYVCVAEMFGKSEESFVEGGTSEEIAKLHATISFFIGCLFMHLMGFLVSLTGDPGHTHDEDIFSAMEQMKREEGQLMSNKKHVEEKSGVTFHTDDNDKDKDVESQTMKTVSTPNEESDSGSYIDNPLYKLGVKTVIAIVLHNFPEGFASYITTMDEGRSGYGIAFGVILHNIPEGLCVSVPIYMATKDKKQPFLWSGIAGLAELLGGFVAFLASGGNIHGSVYGALYGIVNGIVLYVCVSDFIPIGYKMDPTHGKFWFTTSFLIGAFIISITLVVEGF